MEPPRHGRLELVGSSRPEIKSYFFLVPRRGVDVPLLARARGVGGDRVGVDGGEESGTVVAAVVVAEVLDDDCGG